MWNPFKKKPNGEENISVDNPCPASCDERLKSKEQKRVAWRNARGEVECGGDNCHVICGWTCPIWVHTEAIARIQEGLMDEAFEYEAKAVSIAPDFKDSWVNMASIYGRRGDYPKAYECYKKAYEIDHYYRNAILA